MLGIIKFNSKSAFNFFDESEDLRKIKFGWHGFIVR